MCTIRTPLITWTGTVSSGSRSKPICIHCKEKEVKDHPCAFRTKEKYVYGGSSLTCPHAPVGYRGPSR